MKKQYLYNAALLLLILGHIVIRFAYSDNYLDTQLMQQTFNPVELTNSSVPNDIHEIEIAFLRNDTQSPY